MGTVVPEDTAPPASHDLPLWLWPRAAYVHVPFCAHHCNYCDFAIAVGQDYQIELYLDALAAELVLLGKPQPVRTLCVGGGTPTHLAPGQLERLLKLLRQWFVLEEGGEFSIEANPGTLAADKVGVLADHGVNRVSLGAQSFQPHLLERLERGHHPADIGLAVERVKRRIAQVSLDLIFGVPGQTLAEFQDDLARALALQTDHISTYGLTYEKGTPLWKLRESGKVIALEEDNELELYRTAIDTLEQAGFEHYEISNFARLGTDSTKAPTRSRHNQVYWANEAYFGAGMGAARYVMGQRELNTRDLNTYLRRLLSGEDPTWQSEKLDPWEGARETMAVQLRRIEGIQRTSFAGRTGLTLDAVAGSALAHLVELGLIQDDGQRAALSRRGKYVADGVIERMLRG